MFLKLIAYVKKKTKKEKLYTNEYKNNKPLGEEEPNNCLYFVY